MNKKNSVIGSAVLFLAIGNLSPIAVQATSFQREAVSEEIGSLVDNELLSEDRLDFLDTDAESVLNAEIDLDLSDEAAEVVSEEDERERNSEAEKVVSENLAEAENQDAELIDSGTLEAGGWRFYSNGLLYFDGVIYPEDRAKWSQYETDIINIEIGHADLIGDYSSFFTSYTNVETIIMEETYLNNVTNMSGMFRDLQNLTDVSFGWAEARYSSSNVTDMSFMFLNCSKLERLNLDLLDTSSVTNMSSMFRISALDASNLTNLDVSNFNTSNVTNMNYIFNGLSSLTSLDVSNFDTSNVKSMMSMFNGLSSLTSLDVSNFDTSNVTSMESMFSRLSQLTSLDVSNFDTSDVTIMSSMFRGLSSLTSLDVSNFDTSNVTQMITMFSETSSLSKLNLGNFDTSSVASMDSIFWGADSLATLILGSKTRLYGNVRLRTLPINSYWKESLNGNLLSTSALRTFHNNLNQQNTYEVVQAVSLTFDSMGGSLINDVETNIGGIWTEPANPTKDGFTFLGWYLDREYTQRFDFNTIAEQDTTVYAKWIEEYVVQIPAKISLNSEEELSLSATNNGEKTLAVSLKNENSELNDAAQLTLTNKNHSEIKAVTQLSWQSMEPESKWNVLSVKSDEDEKTKEASISFEKPKEVQTGSYQGILTFDITYR
ncbi:BspA family leucine-rich repeat surface protein [Enterococcus malodoratus]|uniref:BspA family leucine-rich repeat surface protein n=1 Tax=Enterococcus malodoratus TaxID=71451 RepID=UPI000ABC73EE|nr:BspA family leucine-rich repeat surface protein [Enterococcus malodoratus]